VGVDDEKEDPWELVRAPEVSAPIMNNQSYLLTQDDEALKLVPLNISKVFEYQSVADDDDEVGKKKSSFELARSNKFQAKTISMTDREDEQGMYRGSLILTRPYGL